MLEFMKNIATQENINKLNELSELKCFGDQQPQKTLFICQTCILHKGTKTRN